MTACIFQVDVQPVQVFRQFKKGKKVHNFSCHYPKVRCAWVGFVMADRPPTSIGSGRKPSSSLVFFTAHARTDLTHFSLCELYFTNCQDLCGGGFDSRTKDQGTFKRSRGIKQVSFGDLTCQKCRMLLQRRPSDYRELLWIS